MLIRGPHIYLQHSKNISDIKYRIFTIVVVFSFAFLSIFVRLGKVMLFGEGHVLNQRQTSEFKTQRANITDRNGHIIATQLVTASVFVNPRVIINKEEVISKLGKLFPEVDVSKKINTEKSFVWIKRHISPKMQAKIHSIGLPGVYLKKDEKRVYPFGSLFSHIIGTCNSEGSGVFGVERFFDNSLLENTEHSLRLTLDIRIQHIIYEALKSGIDEFKADGGYAVAMEVGTGNILSIVSLPDFDPNQSKIDTSLFFNPAVQASFEHGSTFKIFNTAIALDSGAANLKTKVDATSKIRIGKFVVDDFKGAYKFMDLCETFVRSSNIASIKFSQIIGMLVQKNYFKKFGLFEKVPFLKEAANPIYPSTWTNVTTMTSSYGYGISVTPMQLIRAVHAIINDGIIINPSITFSNHNLTGKKVISSEVSKIMRRFMRQAVQEKAKKADIDGYEVIGKSGTAYQRQGLKGYGAIKKRNASIICAFPEKKPKILLFLSLNDPKPIAKTFGYATAGWNAAEVAGKIIEKIGPILNIEYNNTAINNDYPKLMLIKAKKQ